MHRARDRQENEEWLAELNSVADALDLDGEARSAAEELFLSSLPDEERSKRATMAASLYAAALIGGQERSQSVVAEAADVSRLSVQQRWKDLLDAAGLQTPDW